MSREAVGWELLEDAGDLVQLSLMEDPTYHVADVRLA